MVATSFNKLIGEPSIAMFAKMQIEGHGTGLEKCDYVLAIEKRADELFDGTALSAAQKFTRTITEDEVGKLLYQAAKAAPGNEVKAPPQEEPQDFVKRAAERTGPAHAKLHSLAVDAHRADPQRTYAQAYSAIYTAPENAELRAAAKSEHLAVSMVDVPRALR